MWLVEKNNNIESEIQKRYSNNNRIYKFAIWRGYSNGYDNGFEDGLKKARNEYKAAISDGLRCGSKECARIMGMW